MKSGSSGRLANPLEADLRSRQSTRGTFALQGCRIESTRGTFALPRIHSKVICAPGRLGPIHSRPICAPGSWVRHARRPSTNSRRFALFAICSPSQSNHKRGVDVMPTPKNNLTSGHHCSADPIYKEPIARIRLANSPLRGPPICKWIQDKRRARWQRCSRACPARR